MKKVTLPILGALFLLLTLPVAHAQTKPKINAAVASPAAAGSGFTQIVTNWSYTPNLPVCSGLLTACYDGFVLSVNGAVVADQTKISASSLSYTYTPAGGVPFGNITLALHAHGYDQNGAVLISADATATVVVPVSGLNAPTGLSGKAQP